MMESDSLTAGSITADSGHSSAATYDTTKQMKILVPDVMLKYSYMKGLLQERVYELKGE